ncbi:peptidyl-prolyl cis-trans isomerase FKBP19, chloroplastic [Durio zibethinus]|uniref:peptidylprolyl isomerase n=1 Tax=Durio zibethinus TaxID=66656 RepID=A0A6P5XAW1_DURZI|nr:peptidyl-prolyl cis-trans isomerase FKBP19, chloroplastic [Durio zibethinus]
MWVRNRKRRRTKKVRPLSYRVVEGTYSLSSNTVFHPSVTELKNFSLMASISAAGSLPQSLILSAGRASTRRRYGPMISLSVQHQQQQQSQLIERRKVIIIPSVGLVAGALWDSSLEEIGMATAASSGFADMPALRGKDYGKTKMRFPDYTQTESGLQYKDLRVGDGPTPKMGETVVVDWDGYTIGYYGRIFEARNKTKGGSFVGDDKDFFKFRLGSQEVIPAFEEAVSGMALGGVRRIIVPPELGYPENDFNKSGPRPTTFSGQRALDFVLRNQGLIDKTLLFDIELLKIIPN